MDDPKLEQELSAMFSTPVDEEAKEFEELAGRVWRRNRRAVVYANCAVFCAALVGCAVSYLAIGVYGPVPALLASLDIRPVPIGNQWIGVIGMMGVLMASLRLSVFASEP